MPALSVYARLRPHESDEDEGLLTWPWWVRFVEITNAIGFTFFVGLTVRCCIVSARDFLALGNKQLP